MNATNESEITQEIESITSDFILTTYIESTTSNFVLTTYSVGSTQEDETKMKLHENNAIMCNDLIRCNMIYE